MPHPRRRKVNLPLVEIIAASLIIHVVGLLILGGITIFNQINVEEPILDAPPVTAPPAPPQKIPVQLTKKTPSTPPNVIARDLQNMPIMDLEFDVPLVDQRVGVGTGGMGRGLGNGGIVDLGNIKGLDFIGIQDNAESVLFIVDYSQSMKENVPGGNMTRFELLKEQLTASLAAMPDQMMVSVIFFSGPAWVAGESEKSASKNYSSEKGDWHSHRPKDVNALTKPEWHRMSPAYKSQIINIVQKEKMTGGTVWGNPLILGKMLDPPPEVIYFLTDGATSDLDVKETLDLVSDWKKDYRDLRINTIALGEPRAASAMRRIAGRTNGKFRLIESMDDIKRQVDKNDS